MLNISLSCPGLSYHYHPSKTRSWNLNPASYAICQGSWMMKGQRERYTIGGEEKAIIVWQQEGGKQEEKKVRSLFCFWWGSWVSSVNPLNTHTDVSRIPRHHRPHTRVWFGKKTASIFQKTDHGDESMADMINMSPITKCAIFWNPLESCLHDKYKISNLSLIQKYKLMYYHINCFFIFIFYQFFCSLV